MQLPDRSFLFGRVVRALDLAAFSGVDSNEESQYVGYLVYVYSYRRDSPAAPENLRVTDLLIAPQVINRLGWSRGYLQTIEHRPLTDTETLPVHVFKDLRQPPRFYDEHGTEVSAKRAARARFISQSGAGNYRTLDDQISEALGLPLAPD
jgi:Immunity protein 26